MITKKDKKIILEKLKDIFANSKSAVFVNFKGLRVAEISSIRKNLKSEGVSYLVARKTLVNRALDEASTKGVKPELAGELAIAYLSTGNEKKKDEEDLLSPARSIYQFQKKMDGKIQIMGGLFEGEYKDKSAMVSIASIPSLNVLRGMFVNVINSPIQRFVVALNAIAQTKK